MRIKQPLSRLLSSPLTLLLFGGALFFGVVYGWTAPPAAGAALIFCIALAFLGFLRVLNSAANRFPPPIARSIHWVHALVFEGIFILALIVLRLIHCLSWRRMAAVGSATGRPILLIHGYFDNSSAWAYQKRQLAKRGFGPIYTVDLGHPCRSIRCYAEKVGESAERIERETNRRDLILIGHSMGGLVSAWYATRVASPGKVTDVITIGSPLEGTHLARIGIGPNAREMERGSELLKELQQGMEKSIGIRFYHIATKTDQLIIPNSSAIVGDHPERQFIVEDIGHVTLLFSPRVARKIADWLKQHWQLHDGAP